MQRSTCRYDGHCPPWLAPKLHVKTRKLYLPHAKGRLDVVSRFYLGLIITEAKMKKRSTFYSKGGYTVSLGYINALSLENVRADRKVVADWPSMDNLRNYSKSLTWKKGPLKKCGVLFCCVCCVERIFIYVLLTLFKVEYVRSPNYS